MKILIILSMFFKSMLFSKEYPKTNKIYDARCMCWFWYWLLPKRHIFYCKLKIFDNSNGNVLIFIKFSSLAAPPVFANFQCILVKKISSKWSYCENFQHCQCWEFCQNTNIHVSYFAKFEFTPDFVWLLTSKCLLYVPLLTPSRSVLMKILIQLSMPFRFMLFSAECQKTNNS